MSVRPLGWCSSLPMFWAIQWLIANAVLVTVNGLMLLESVYISNRNDIGSKFTNSFQAQEQVIFADLFHGRMILEFCPETGTTEAYSAKILMSNIFDTAYSRLLIMSNIFYTG